MKIIPILVCLQLTLGLETPLAPAGLDFKRSLFRTSVKMTPERGLTAETPVVAYGLPNLAKELGEDSAAFNWKAVAEGNIVNIKRQLPSGQVQTAFQCTIEVSNKNAIKLDRKYIVCSNFPINAIKSDKFAHLATDHMVLRRAISNGNLEAQRHFIKDVVQKLKTINDRNSSLPKAVDLKEFVSSVISKEKIEDIIIKDKFVAARSVGFDIYTKDNQKLYQGIGYTISPFSLGLDFSIPSEDNIFKISRRNLDSASEEIKNVLSKKPEEDKLKRLELGDVPSGLKDAIVEICATDKPAIKIGKKGESYTSLEITHDPALPAAKPEEACPFIGGNFIAVYYHYGYMQFFHIRYESKYFIHESVVLAKKDKFQDQIKAYLTVISENTKLIAKAHTDSTQEYMVTKEAIKECLEKGLAEAPKDLDFSQAEKDYYARMKIGPIAKFNLEALHVDVKVVKNNDGFVIKLNKTPGENFAPVYGEITLPMVNGYDYKESLVKTLEDYKKRVDENPAATAAG